MNKRRHQRTPISLEAVLSADGMSHKVFLSNLSDCGVGVYFETSTHETGPRYSTGTGVMLDFQAASGKTIQLTCVVKWRHVYKYHEWLISLGIEIVDPPQCYKEYFKTLTMSYCPA